MLEEKNITTGDNQNIQFYVSGTGRDTVVLMSGFGSPSTYSDFYLLIQELQYKYRILVYNRPGYANNNYIKGAAVLNNSINYLYETITCSNLSAPFILVAHSVGSLDVLHFASLYPHLVKAIVLIDGASPKTYGRFDKDKPLRLLRAINNNRWLFSVAVKLGLFADLRNRKQYLPAPLYESDKRYVAHNFANEAMIELSELVKDNAVAVYKNMNIRNTPLLVITARKTLSDRRFRFTNWEQDQHYLLSLSDKSKQVLLDGEHSLIVMEQAKEIASEMNIFLLEMNKKA